MSQVRGSTAREDTFELWVQVLRVATLWRQAALKVGDTVTAQVARRAASVLEELPMEGGRLARAEEHLQRLAGLLPRGLDPVGEEDLAAVESEVSALAGL